MFSRQLHLFQHPLSVELLGNMPDVLECSDELGSAIVKRRKTTAIKKPYLRYNNKLANSIILDLDYPSLHAWEDVGAPPPNFVVVNKRNLHSHYIYSLTFPVKLYDCSSTAPMRKMAVVANGLTKQLKADQMFSGYLAKSLWSDTWEPHLVEKMSYELEDISGALDPELLNQPIRRRKGFLDFEDYTSRNVWLFDVLRHHAYSYFRECSAVGELYEELMNEGMKQNHSFPSGCKQASIHLNELMNICRSIAKWVWANFSKEEFSRIQSYRGSLKGKKKKELLLPKVMELVKQGRSHRSIAKELGISPPTITNWLKV